MGSEMCIRDRVRSHDEVSNINVNDDVMLSWRLEDFLVHEG